MPDAVTPDATRTADRLYRMAAALRSRFAELRPLTVDPTLAEVLDDLSGQHGRHASELLSLVNDSTPLGRLPGEATDGAGGDEHLTPPSLPLGMEPSMANILAGAIAAECQLRDAYHAAAGAEPDGSALASTYRRHEVAVGTIISRLDAMSGST